MLFRVYLLTINIGLWPSCTASLHWVHRSFPMTFVAVFDPSSSEDPCFRMKCFDSGANMVSHDVHSLVHTLETSVLSIGRSGGRYSCPYCPATGLTERDLWYHCPAYHINVTNESVSDTHCPICETRTRIPMQVKSCQCYKRKGTGLDNYFML